MVSAAAIVEAGRWAMYRGSLRTGSATPRTPVWLKVRYAPSSVR
jgi:hypothetical protein